MRKGKGGPGLVGEMGLPLESAEPGERVKTIELFKTKVLAVAPACNEEESRNGCGKWRRFVEPESTVRYLSSSLCPALHRISIITGRRNDLGRELTTLRTQYLCRKPMSSKFFVYAVDN